MNIVILDDSTISQGKPVWNELSALGSLHVYARTAPEEIILRSQDADAILTSKCNITKEVMDACPNLKYIGVLATGYNMVDLEHAKEKGIAVTNIPAYSTDSVAQLVFSLILTLANHVELHDAEVKRGVWESCPDFGFIATPQTEISGLTLGVIGFGNIGQKVASIARAFGMNVIVSTAYPSPELASDKLQFADDEEVYRRADIITLHRPLSDNNKGFVNKQSIGKMKDGVWIINTSRGPLINEQDLANALAEGKVAAAAVDVLSTEPPRSDNPLIGAKNCIITPHIAWGTGAAVERLIEIATSNYKAFLDGKSANRIV